MKGWLAVVALAACGGGGGQTEALADKPEELLKAYLADAHVAELRMDQATFVKTVAPSFRGLYDDYVREYDAGAQALAARIEADRAMPRKHFATDKQNTLEQERLRWALPTLYPSLSAAGTVFVRSGDRFYALAGLDAAMVGRVAERDAACAKLLDHVMEAKPCADVGWVVVDAGIRNDRPELARACRLAERVCGNRSP